MLGNEDFGRDSFFILLPIIFSYETLKPVLIPTINFIMPPFILLLKEHFLLPFYNQFVTP